MIARLPMATQERLRSSTIAFCNKKLKSGVVGHAPAELAHWQRGWLPPSAPVHPWAGPRENRRLKKMYAEERLVKVPVARWQGA